MLQLPPPLATRLLMHAPETAVVLAASHCVPAGQASSQLSPSEDRYSMFASQT
jgi:hypothetical protein